MTETRNPLKTIEISEKKTIEAQNSLAFCYLTGTGGIPQDEKEGIKRLRTSKAMSKLDEFFVSLEEKQKKILKDDYKKYLPDFVTVDQIEKFHPSKSPSEIDILNAVHFRNKKFQDLNQTHGFCFGLSILMFKFTLQGLRNELIYFYIMLMRYSLDMPQEEKDKILKIVIELEWAQHINYYKTQDGLTKLGYRNIDIILKELTGLPIKKIFSSCPDQAFSRNDLNMLLTLLDQHKVMSLSSTEPEGKDTHAIGILCDKDGNYIITDNFSIELIPFSESHLIYDIVKQRLYRKEISGDKIPMEICLVGDEKFLNKSEEKQAITYFQNQAKQGDPEAQLFLGYLLSHGIGFPEDEKKACEWFRHAAEQGNAAAQYCLGYCLANGIGIPANKKKALEWYQEAALQGNYLALVHIGYCLQHGEGIEKNEKKAVELYRIAANKGDASAQFHLGYCLENGIGISANKTKAIEWYQKAALQGYSYAQNNLGCCLEHGEGIEKDEKRAVEWYRQAAEQGNARAQFNLGCCLERGIGIASNPASAIEWYQRAALQGSKAAEKAIQKINRRNLSWKNRFFSCIGRRSNKVVPLIPEIKSTAHITRLTKSP